MPNIGVSNRPCANRIIAGATFLIIIVTSACGTSEEANFDEFFEADEDIRYDYVEDSCEKSGIQNVSEVGEGFELDFTVTEEISEQPHSQNIRCTFENNVESNSPREDSYYADIELSYTIIGQIDSLHHYNDAYWRTRTSTEYAAFEDGELTLDNWDYADIRSRSSIEGAYRVAEGHFQHEHLIVNIESQVATAELARQQDLEFMTEEDFNDEVWGEMQEFDDDFQREYLDFIIGVADNLQSELDQEGS